jgi:hypothetical protein
MVGLIDIAPSVETVDMQGTSVTVHGVSAKGLAHLLGRFPELRMLMTGQEVETPALMAMGGDAVAAIIAAGCGYPGDVHLARFAAGSERAECELLSRLALPAPPREIQRPRDLTRRHRPYLGRRINGADQRVDGFRNFEAGAVAD